MASTPYSRDTFASFAKIRHYVSVRIKQGVPLVEADLNEQDDLRRYELRNFLRWFVGDGIPDGNNGFRILPSGVPNDVLIAGGTGTPEGAGRCLVDGLEVLNEADVAFSAQEFADPVQAATAGIPPVVLPVTPGAPRTDLYYLDVFEREITSAEAGHADIVDPRIGIEAARRIRREWAVRVVDAAIGVSADDTPPGHRYYPLASVVRLPGVAIIPVSAITDLRRRGVTLISRANVDQFTGDAFGTGYTLTPDGRPTLAMPLRTVINAILRDGRPAVIGPTIFQTANGPHAFPAAALSASGEQWVFWLNGNQVFFQRESAGVWSVPAVAFPASGSSQSGTTAFGMPDGSIWLLYSARVGLNATVVARVWDSATWGAEFTVSSAVGVNDLPRIAIDPAGAVMVVWRFNGNEVWSRRFVGGVAQAPVQVSTAAEPVPTAIGLTVDPAGDFHLYAAEQVPAPTLWPIRTKKWHLGFWDAAYPPPLTTIPVSAFLEFLAIPDRFGGTWFIWATQVAGTTNVLRGLRVVGTTVGNVADWVQATPRAPTATPDVAGNLQVFFREGAELHRIHVIYEI